MNIGRDGFRGGTHIRKSEIVGDDSSPAVGAKLDLRMSHPEVKVLLANG
jgi:hypothetical protein